MVEEPQTEKEKLMKQVPFINKRHCKDGPGSLSLLSILRENVSLVSRSIFTVVSISLRCFATRYLTSMIKQYGNPLNLSVTSAV